MKKLQGLIVGLLIALVPAIIIGVALTFIAGPWLGWFWAFICFVIGLDIVFNGTKDKDDWTY
jgi:type IV secretory pathway VirB2 component (pilin)